MPLHGRAGLSGTGAGDETSAMAMDESNVFACALSLPSPLRGGVGGGATDSADRVVSPSPQGGRERTADAAPIEPHLIELYPSSTGPPAFFQASMPPAIWAALASPASLAAVTAIAERSP